jgi:hypothetical protein
MEHVCRLNWLSNWIETLYIPFEVLSRLFRNMSPAPADFRKSTADFDLA